VAHWSIGPWSIIPAFPDFHRQPLTLWNPFRCAQENGGDS
jgi:hypothetical protein